MFERWQSLPPNKVFDDKEGNRYIIPYDVGARTDDNKFAERTAREQNKLKVLVTGIFLEHLGIPTTADTKYKIEGRPGSLSLEQLSLTIAEFGGTFTHPTRLDQNTRVLVFFPKEFLPEVIIPDGVLTEEQQPENQEIIGPVVTPPQRIIAEAFHSDEIHSLIRDAENNIQYFSVRAENFKGTIENLSFDEDIKKLNLIVPKIKTFLRENNIEFSKQESQTLEFQFDENYKLKRFLIALEDGTTREPKIGFKTLASEDPFSSYRIMVYFTFLKELAKTKTRSLTLMDFIETYVKPDPVIKYGETSAIDQVKELQEEQRREGDNCIENPVQDLVDFIKDEQRYNKFLKNYETLFNAHVEAVENKFDNTEFHPVLGENTQDVIDKISTAADLYEQWWRKADGKEIALRLLQCLGVELPTDFCFTPAIFEANILAFNEDLPIIDWSGDFIIELENSLSTFLVDTILGVALGLLNELNLREVCETAINDVLSERPSFVGEAEAEISINTTIGVTLAGTRREKTLSTSVREFFEIEDGEDLSNVDPGKYEILRQELIAIIEDLFLVLTNEEICRLFRGESNDKDIFYIQSLVKNKYANSPALFLFETKTSIIDTFSQLGKEIDLGFCEIQLSEDVQNLKIYDLCTIRSDLIDDCLSPQQLDAELEKLRRAKCEQIERLKDIIENGFMPDTIPSALCTIGENGEKIPGLVNEPATSAYVINNAIDASFENIYISFGAEAEQWKDNLITIEEKKKQVEILIPEDPNVSPATFTVNPEVQMLISQGQPSEQFYEEEVRGGIVEKRYIDGVEGNNLTDIVKKEKSIAASLFQTLNDARAGSLEIKSTEDSVYFQLDIPANPEKQALNSLLSEISALIPRAEDRSALDKVTKTLVDSCSKEGKIDSNTIKNIINDLGSTKELRKVFNAASLLNRPDLFELDNIKYSLRFAQEKIDKNIENFEGYRKSNYISIIANLKDDQDNDVEYEIVRFYGDDVDSELGEVLNNIPSPLEADLKSANEPGKTFESLAFAKYCTSMWEKNGFQQNVGFFGGNFITELFANNYYYDVLGFIDSYMLEKIIDSPFFNIQKFEEVDLNPPRTQREIECNIQNNLLIIDNNKQKIIDDYNKNKCDTRDLIINGKPNPGKLNPLDLALLKQQALTLVRLYIIDYCLRGIFPVSTFKKDSGIENDRTFIAFLYEMMTEELRSFDEDFYMSFENLCLDIYLEANNDEEPPVSEIDYKEFLVNNDSEEEFLRIILEKQSSNEENIDVILNQEELSDNEVEQSLQIQNAIKFLIKDQISNVYEKILLALNSAGIPELKEQFLMSLPETFVAKDVENDTFRYLNDLVKNIKDERSIDSLREVIYETVKALDDRKGETVDETEKQLLDFQIGILNNIDKVSNDQLVSFLEANLGSGAIPGFFNLIESEASKLSLASKFFVEKYCVIEDYTEEELTAKIEEAKQGFLTEDAEENERIIREFRAQKTSEISAKRQEIDSVSIMSGVPNHILTIVRPSFITQLPTKQTQAGPLNITTTESFLVNEITKIISRHSYTEQEFFDSIANSIKFSNTNEIIVFYNRQPIIPVGYYFDVEKLKIYKFTTRELLREVNLDVNSVGNIPILAADGFSRDFSSTDEIQYSNVIPEISRVTPPDNFNYFKNIFNALEDAGTGFGLNEQLTDRGFAGDASRQVKEGFGLYREWRRLSLDLLRGPETFGDPRPTSDVVDLILNRDARLTPAEVGQQVVCDPALLVDFFVDTGLKPYSLSYIFKSLKYGTRLVFVPDEEFEYNSWLKETTDATDNIQNLKLFNLKQQEGNQTLTKHPFAVAQYQVDSKNIDFEGSGVKVFDTKITYLLLNDDILHYDDYRRQLLQGLKQSQGYKFLFDYAFSLYDLSSFYTIFSSITASKKQGVPINWDGTKAALILLITMTNNRGRFDHTSNQPLLNDPVEFSKAFDKAFDILQSCGPLVPCNLINLGLGGLSSFGFAMKFAIKTPKLIFKGLTELIDPNISIASKIKCIGGTEVPIELVSLALLPAPLIPPPFGIGPPLTPLGIAYLLLFGGAFDLGQSMEVNTGDLIDTFAGGGQSSVTGRLSSDCSE